MSGMNPKNRAVLQFTQDISSRLSLVCAPLFQQSLISHFSYMKIFDNGTRLFLCPNAKWVGHYIQNNFQDDPVHPKHRPKKPGIHYGIWTAYNRDKIFSSLFELDIWHGFTIFDRHEHHLECYHFATQRKNDQFVNFYLENIDALTQFIFYFKDKMSDIILEPRDDYLIVSEKSLAYEFNKEALLNSGDQNNPNFQKFVFETLPQKYTLEFNGKYYSFSRREIECFLHVFKGKTAKVIGRQLNLSPRTVETYINNLKNKVGLSSMTQLYPLLLENPLIQYLIDFKEYIL